MTTGGEKAGALPPGHAGRVSDRPTDRQKESNMTRVGDYARLPRRATLRCRVDRSLAAGRHGTSFRSYFPAPAGEPNGEGDNNPSGDREEFDE